MGTIKYTASFGDTWDTVAYKVCGDEFECDALRRANRPYSDVLVFDGGESLIIPSDIGDSLTSAASSVVSSASVRVIAAEW